MIRRAVSSSSPLPFDRVSFMGAVVEPISLDDERRVYEPKYGGIRVKEAVKRGWEGIMAKRAASPYRSKKHHADWRKIKLLDQQEFVVGGWTESASRPFRALLIGVYTDSGDLEYVGRMGKAFSERLLEDLGQQLGSLERLTCPFREKPQPFRIPSMVLWDVPPENV